MILWRHKKNRPVGPFKGTYERDKKGERIFVLTRVLTERKVHRRIVFESWQAAKKLGWTK